MVEEQVTGTVEEYLETIYRLQAKTGDGARTNDLVRSLKVVPGTITNTIERLEKEGFVEHEPYRGVRLTERGRRIAVQVLRRHRLSERLLTDILRIDPSRVHETACKIEHDIADEEIMAKIEEALGNPKTCPHGDPIPSKDSRPTEERHGGKDLPTLAGLEPSEEGIVVRIRDDDLEALQYLSKLGIVPGKLIEVVRKEPAEDLVFIRAEGSAVHAISERMASVIEVKVKGIDGRQAASPKAETQRKPTYPHVFGEYES